MCCRRRQGKARTARRSCRVIRELWKLYVMTPRSLLMPWMSAKKANGVYATQPAWLVSPETRTLLDVPPGGPLAAVALTDAR
jgi:hypothetical protein